MFAVAMWAIALVIKGIDRFSRNPMHLGCLLVLVAWVAFLANGAFAFMRPAFVACMNRFQIRPEERALQRIFGSEFMAYHSSVRRWL